MLGLIFGIAVSALVIWFVRRWMNEKKLIAKQTLKGGDVTYNDVKDVPSIFTVALRVILHGTLKSEGKLLPGAEKKDIATNIVIKTAKIEENNLRAYNKICEVSSDKLTVPVCYLDVLWFRTIPQLVTRRDWPISPMALIHIKQEHIYYRAIKPTDKLNLKMRFSTGDIEKGEKGYIITITQDAFVGKEKVWDSTMKLLSRYPKKTKGPRKKHEKPDVSSFKQSTIAVAKDVSTKYATISGDYNLQHLPYICNLVGYKRPIVHGLWAMQRCFAQLQKDIGTGFPDFPYKFTTEFKMPIYMPSTNTMLYKTSDDKIDFELRSKDLMKLHLIGSVKPHKED